MFTLVLVSLARLFRHVVLGPLWAVPMGAWSRLVHSRLPRAVVGLAALPGFVACAVWLWGLVAQWPLATIGPAARAGFRCYSPIHRLTDQAAQLLVLLQTVPMLDVLAALASLWLTVAVLTTVFLSPIYLWLAKRDA